MTTKLNHKDRKRKIILTAGGTGGHIYPALALADLWKEQDPQTEFLFIGNDDRMEATLIPERGYPFIGLHSSGLEISLAHKIKAVFQTISCYFKACRIMKNEKPDLVVGFGGYVTAPVLAAARSVKIPYMIHEQNSVVGKANRMVMKEASGIAVCYEKCFEVFEGSKTRLIGNPRASLAVQASGGQAYFESLGLKKDKKTIMIVMGSLGSSSVNDLMKEALNGIDPSLQVLYVCGKQNPADPKDFPEHVIVQDFVNTTKIYPFLDGIICRAGATTLCEVEALGIPAIIIPSPYVANNHQFYNASILTQNQAALMIEEKDLNAKTLKEAIDEAFVDEGKRQQLHENALKMGTPDAAYDLIQWADEIIDKGH
ncbi:undecaprenyldiphospho-muramoylpentapeptide beta-N-acetylglucosaminyltransferase [Ileibacterium valens]|uniref:undecaprenyldiphospho-muramoylpentapeptide beta-N-acetylglucosaminyltransferase n=1 Tax=Ileibacterium valens TaxID=1862668 RepID=UPI0024BA98DF|nr:undecaprenyldiphospho-muramoylpentapeptide beta-N-acetylglucosaminyltransferase [Ileibacterium valens]